MTRTSFGGKHPASCRLLILLFFFSLANGCATTKGVVESAMDGSSEFVDLSHSLRAGTPTDRIDGAFRLTAIRTLDRDGIAVNKLEMPETSGTNIEAPSRLVAGAVSVDSLAMGLFLGHGVVLNVTEQVAKEDDYKVTRGDLEAWEADHGPIPTESIVLIRTGWSNRWSEPDRYLNLDDSGHPVYPGISAEAVEFLVRERRVHALGIDTPSLYAGSGNTTAQMTFLTSGKYHINNLTDLDRLPQKGSLILAIPLKVEEGSGSPARVIAIIPRQKNDVEPGKKRVQQETSMGADSPGGMGQPRY